MKQTIQLLFLMMLLFFTIGCEKEKKTTQVPFDKNSTTLIHIYGKTDKRLHLDFYVTYRPKYNPDGKVSKECKQALHPATATQQGKLSYAGISIENQDEYNITLPIYNKTLYQQCQSTPVGISVRITRLHEKHKQYSVVPIYTDTPLQTWEKGIVSGNLKGDYRAQMLKERGKVSEPPKYFRIRDGANVACYTRHYAGDRESKEHVRFRCDLPYKGNASWRDKIVDDKIHLDIMVDEQKSYYYPPLQQIHNGVKGHSEPFQEEKLNIFDKLKLKLGGKL